MPKYVPANKVDCRKIKPFLKELIDRCGNTREAAAYSGIGTSTIYRVMHEEYCTVLEETAEKILVSLKHKRIMDRKNGVVNPALKKAKAEQARIESNQERLAGY